MANGILTTANGGTGVEVQKPDYSGKIHEKVYLGGCRWKAPEDFCKWWNCVKEITRYRHQTGTYFTKELRTQISQVLMAEKSNIVLYSCLDTPMDKYHGVDCFIIWWGSSRQESGRIVTLDITLKDGKANHRADVLVTPSKLGNFKGLVQEIVNHLTKNPPKVYYNDPEGQQI